jgi:hypothetical protein
MSQIDYDVPATLFISYKADAPGQSRTDALDFSTLAEAIKHAVEEVSRERIDLDLTHISAATQRLAAEDIYSAYGRDDFPLKRGREP